MKYKLENRYNLQTKRKRRSQPSNLLAIGKKLIALIMLSSVGYMIYPRDIYKGLAAAFNDFSPKFNLPIHEIDIYGLEKVTPEDIAHLVDFNIGDGMYSIDLNLVKERLENYPWIASAVVERILPSTIRIKVTEEVPKAIFIQDNERYFINYEGKLIEKITDASIGENYIYLSGEGANLTYSDILDHVYANEEIYSRIEGLVKIGQRRWDLKLKNNITLKLPQNDIIEALSKFSKVIDDNIDFFKSGTIIDLRFMPEKIYIK